MSKFIYKTIFLLLPIILILVSVNYYCDPAHIFHDDYVKKMVDIIQSGKNVTNIINYDERLFQEQLISKISFHPRTVIIGSSRTYLLNSINLSDGTLQNNSVSGASIEDIIAIYQIYKKNNKLPSKIIIGIDPWTFNENNDQIRWKSLKKYYNIYNHKKDTLDNKLSNWFKYQELFSLSYFQNAISKLPDIFTGNSEPKATNKKLNITDTILLDGSYVYNRSLRESSIFEIRFKSQTYVFGRIYGIENFNHISLRILNEFERLMTDIKEKNILAVFFLTPYFPTVYQFIEKKYPMVIKTEQIITQYAKANGITIYGSFNPLKLGMDESYFYDGMHCNEKGISYILNNCRRVFK